MDSETATFCIVSFIFFGAIVLTLGIHWYGHTQGYEDGYKQGQIDALNGENNFTLIEFNDGTREYYKDPRPSDFTQPFKIIK